MLAAALPRSHLSRASGQSTALIAKSEGKVLEETTKAQP